MADAYAEMRKLYRDGMSLACAIPRQGTYQDTVRDYSLQRNEPGFSTGQFWEDRFSKEQPGKEAFIAPPGMGITDYIRESRGRSVRHSDDPQNGVGLPHDYLVANNDRFPYWFQQDGYLSVKGCAAGGEWQPVLDAVDNSEYLINHFGRVPNGSADFLITRAHPPYFDQLVAMTAEKYGPEALRRYLPALEKEYQGYWMEGREELERLPDDGKVHGHRSLIRVPQGNGNFAYLNRYWDDADGPRLESYLEDVELGKIAVHGLEGEVRQRQLQKFYKDVRGGAASSWDYSSRWFADGKTMKTINTTDILPIDLNSLLARYEQVLADAHLADGNYEEAMRYGGRFQQRVAAINKLLWDPKDQMYRDYNFAQGRQTDIVSAATAFPLYAGIANTDQAAGVARVIENQLLSPGGVVATTSDTDQQWDGGPSNPNVWAPPNWAAARGLARAGDQIKNAGGDGAALFELAERVRANYMSGVELAFNEHRFIPEKIRGDNPRQIAGGGEYQMPPSTLAMSRDTYDAMRKWKPRDPDGCLPIGHHATYGLVTMQSSSR
jgi:alpha,alpha-trehalase